MSFTYVPIVGTYEDGKGNPARGWVSFEPAVTMRNGTTVVDAPVVVRLDASGALPADLVLAATTDPATMPTGNTYRVVEKVLGETRTYSIEVSHLAERIDLASWPTTEVAPAKVTYELVARRGAPDGYAPLDGAAKVPLPNLPTANLPISDATQAALDALGLADLADVDGTGAAVGQVVAVSAASGGAASGFRTIDPAVLRTDYDTVIVGASEVGVMAAVAAAREGAAVLLVSDNERIGGFSGWAITVTDMLTKYSPGMIGGLARELFSRIAEKETATGNFERWHRTGGSAKPSWYQRAFHEMLAGLPVTILYNANLESVTKAGTRITSAVIGGRTFTAPVWIDATPTGDVIQAADLSRSIGREGSMHGETNDVGIIAPQNLGIDPYVIPGDPASGLLFGVDPAPLGTLGEGDGRVMTFGWRVFLTSMAGEKGSFPAPDMGRYDPAKYELLARLWASNPTYYNDPTNAVARTFQVYPHTLFGGTSVQGGSPYQYIDLNSLGFLSSNYPNAAENLEYITATPARRAEIYDNARQWLLGLFHFILNGTDPRIPANLKAGLSLYGPSTRELQAYGGINPGFYIREGCRVVGDFVLAQQDAIVNNGYLDQIAWGVYNFDGHPVRVLVDGGVAKSEGTFDNFATGQTAGFPVPYRVLLPKSAECTNLLCPGQPSVSRYVWTAVRAIPVWLHLGEAAGIAAALAVREGVTVVQNLDVTRIQAVQNLQNVKPAASLMSSDGFYGTGTRTESGTGAAFAQITGADKRWGWLAATTGGSARAVAAGTDRQMRFAPNLYRNGRYRVFLYYPPAESTDILRASNVQVTISHADGTTVRTVNQRYPGGDGGGWDDLGEYYFVKGTPSANYVEIDANGTDGQVVISAVKWVLVP